MMKPFVKMPSRWIMYPGTQGGLKSFSWQGKNRSRNIAALMLYIAILHNANENPTPLHAAGTARISYSELQKITGLSRTMIAAGLRKLEEQEIILANKENKTSVYQLVDNYFTDSWAKLPFKSLYTGGNGIGFFYDLNLRKKVELDALKLYLLIAAFRNNQLNHMSMAYPKIADYTGIQKNHVKSAVSFLVVNQLIQVDQLSNFETRSQDPMNRVNHYRLIGLGSHHFGNMDIDALTPYEDIPF